MSSKPRKIASVQGGVAIVNHCAVVNLLRIANLLRRSIFSTAGSFGLGGLDRSRSVSRFSNRSVSGR